MTYFFDLRLNQRMMMVIIYNDKCKGDHDYETNGIDNVYKTICMTPKKYYENKNENEGILV